MPELILSGFGDEICDDFAGQLDAMAQMGLQYIDPRGVNGKNISELTPQEAAAARQMLDARGFRVGCIGSPIGKYPIDKDFAPELDRFQRTLDNTLALGAGSIRIFSFFIPAGHAPGEYREEVMSRLARLLEASKGSGVMLLHENEHGIYGDTAARCLDLARTIADARFGLIFDPCNFIFAGESPYPYAYECLREHIFALHIKDGRKKPEQVVPAGHGEGHIPELLHALHESGFSGMATLEPHLGKFTGLAQFESVLSLDTMPDGGADLFRLALDEFKKTAAGSGYCL